MADSAAQNSILQPLPVGPGTGDPPGGDDPEDPFEDPEPCEVSNPNASDITQRKEQAGRIVKDPVTNQLSILEFPSEQV